MPRTRGTMPARPGHSTMSLTWTSWASKPARSNAAAISTSPFTPWSRRMAIGGRTPVAIYGAAMSTAGSKGTAGERPGSPASRMRSYSCRADSGLSRSDWICHVVSLQARCSETRDSLNSTSAPRNTRTWSSADTRATARPSRPCARNTPRTPPASDSRTWMTAPSSSAKSAATSSSLLPQSAPASTVTPARPANDISHRVTNNPPSERS